MPLRLLRVSTWYLALAELLSLPLLGSSSASLGSSSASPAELSSRSVSLDKCPVFYETLVPEPTGELAREIKQWDVRKKTVQDAMAWGQRKGFPLRRFNVMYYNRDWDTIKGMFNALELPVGTYKSQGSLARWATLIMTLAYQKALGMQCMASIEDDIAIPEDFDKRLESVQLPLDGKPHVIKFQDWGEGLVLNLPAIEHFTHKLYEIGVGGGGWNCDQFIRLGYAGDLTTKDVGISKVVETNMGNIWSTPTADSDGFKFKAPEEESPNTDVAKQLSKWDMVSTLLSHRPATPSGGSFLDAARLKQHANSEALRRAALGARLSAAVAELQASDFEAAPSSDDFAGAEEDIVDLVRGAQALIRRLAPAAAAA